MDKFIPTKYHKFKCKKNIQNKMIHDGVLYLARKKVVSAWNFETGALIWKTKIKHGCVERLFVFNCLPPGKNCQNYLVIQQFMDDKLTILDLVDGHLLDTIGIQGCEPYEDFDIMCIWGEYLVGINVMEAVFIVDKTFKIIHLFDHDDFIDAIICDDNLALLSHKSDVGVYNNSFELVNEIVFAKCGESIKYSNGLFYTHLYDTVRIDGDGITSMDDISVYDKKGTLIATHTINDIVDTFIVRNDHLFISTGDFVLVFNEGMMLGQLNYDIDNFLIYDDRLYLFRSGGRTMRLGEYFPQHFAKLTRSQHKLVDSWVTVRDKSNPLIHKDLSLLFCRELLCTGDIPR